MLRRLIVIVFAFLIASCAGVFLLVMAALDGYLFYRLRKAKWL